MEIPTLLHQNECTWTTSTPLAAEAIQPLLRYPVLAQAATWCVCGIADKGLLGVKSMEHQSHPRLAMPMGTWTFIRAIFLWRPATHLVDGNATAAVPLADGVLPLRVWF